MSGLLSFPGLMMTSGEALVGDSIPYSCRFNNDDSAYLSKTFAAAPDNNKKCTISVWIKRADPTAIWDSELDILSGGVDATNNSTFRFAKTGSQLEFEHLDAGITNALLQFNAQVSDMAAWYHCLLVIDTTNSTAADRLRMYINGTELSDYVARTNPAQNMTLDWLGADQTVIGARADAGADFLDGYLSELRVIDGLALTPASFGKLNIDGVWVPADYTAAVYGTNGVYLDFAVATDFGKDVSGNGNDFASSGLTTADRFLDTPTHGFCNLIRGPGEGGDSPKLADGNLSHSGSGGWGWSFARASVLLTSGKWYWEAEFDTIFVATACTFGLVNEAYPRDQAGGQNRRGYYHLDDNGTFYANADGGSAGAITAFNTGDIAQFAYDADSGKFWIGRNGTWNGDPAAGTGQQTTIVAYAVSPASGVYKTSINIANFGGNDFTYAVPTGFNAIRTDNMAGATNATVRDGRWFFETLLYTGDGVTIGSGGQVITGLQFQPDLVWIKNRDTIRDHVLTDSVRGVTKHLKTNDQVSAAAEVTTAESLASFNSNGFTVGSDVKVNANGKDYVAWCWRKSGAAGFDIQTYAGDGLAGNTFAHDLGAAPDLVMVKNRDQPDEWATLWMNTLDTAGDPITDPETDYKAIRSTGLTDDITLWNDTAPSSTVVTLGTNPKVNAASENYVAYLWRQISGFSRIGTYWGDGGATTLQVTCGFRVKFLLIMQIPSGWRWNLTDSVRHGGYNFPFMPLLYASEDFGELLMGGTGSFPSLFLSSYGFALSGSGQPNGNQIEYGYLAMAEHPFKYARAY